MKARLFSLGLTALLGVTAAHAQSGAGLEWHTIDGGGGFSTSGIFTLRGTLGQPDTGSMSGGQFSLSGGFWPGVLNSQLLPALSIRIAASSSVILSWPDPSPGFVLQQTFNLHGPGGGWADVSQTPVVSGANREITLPAADQFSLFRLRRP